MSYTSAMSEPWCGYRPWLYIVLEQYTKRLLDLILDDVSSIQPLCYWISLATHSVNIGRQAG